MVKAALKSAPLPQHVDQLVGTIKRSKTPPNARLAAQRLRLIVGNINPNFDIGPGKWHEIMDLIDQVQHGLGD